MAGEHSTRGGNHSLTVGLATLLVGIVVVAALIFALTAGVGAIWSSVTSSGHVDLTANTKLTSSPFTTPTSAMAPTTSSPSTPTTAVPGAASGQAPLVVIRDVSTPEGSEPAFVGPGGVGAATLFVVTSGESAKVTVKNEDSGPHTFSAPGLGLNVFINPGATETFTFTPKTPGTYMWRCEVPCGSWVMSHPGYMEGNVSVVRS